MIRERQVNGPSLYTSWLPERGASSRVSTTKWPVPWCVVRMTGSVPVASCATWRLSPAIRCQRRAFMVGHCGDGWGGPLVLKTAVSVRLDHFMATAEVLLVADLLPGRR